VARIDRVPTVHRATPDAGGHAAMPSARQRGQSAGHHRAQVGAGRGNAAGGEAARVQFMIGAQHQCLAYSLRAGVVELPMRGELLVDRQLARRAAVTAVIRRSSAQTAGTALVPPRQQCEQACSIVNSASDAGDRAVTAPSALFAPAGG
jgi:hypothetical protein